jgi:hypothetical protein
VDSLDQRNKEIELRTRTVALLQKTGARTLNDLVAGTHPEADKNTARAILAEVKALGFK